jgi:hypothetical protein
MKTAPAPIGREGKDAEFRFRNDLSIILGLLDAGREGHGGEGVAASMNWLEERILTILAIREICEARRGREGLPFEGFCETLLALTACSRHAHCDRRAFHFHGLEHRLAAGTALELGLVIVELLAFCLDADAPAERLDVTRIELLDAPEDRVVLRLVGGRAEGPRARGGVFEGPGGGYARRIVEGLGGILASEDPGDAGVIMVFKRSNILEA